MVTNILRLEHYFINIAPEPVFIGFKRLNDRMARGVEVFGGVLIFRIVTTADVAANFAKTQMHPGISHLQTFFATIGSLGFYIFHLVEVRTVNWHTLSNIPACIIEIVDSTIINFNLFSS